MRLVRFRQARRTKKAGFFNPQEFPFLARFQEDTDLIRTELCALLSTHAFEPWPERPLYGDGWDTFGFYWFGRKLRSNCLRCPRTTQLIESVPRLTTAGFSRLSPGTRIRPHVGYTNRVLRCHVGIIVPAASCGIRVGYDIRSWQEGECLVFDDTVEHESWNFSDGDRIVLLLDFKHRLKGHKLDSLRVGHAPSLSDESEHSSPIATKALPHSRPAATTTVPIRLQAGPADCAAACLASILAFYGRDVSVPEIWSHLGAGPSSTADMIVKTARTFGLTTEAFFIYDRNKIMRFRMPCILHWNNKHFVVLEHIDRDTMHIMDPAFGRRRVAVDEIGSAFVGLLIAFNPLKV